MYVIQGGNGSKNYDGLDICEYRGRYDEEIVSTRDQCEYFGVFSFIWDAREPNHINW